jgi:multidrug resistance efflux pump
MPETTTPPIERSDTESFSFRYQNGRSAGAVPSSRDAVVRPTPLRRPSKVRFLAAGLLMVVTCGAVYGVWETCYRYQAFGVVTGTIIEVSPAIDGQIRFLHAREGDEVAHGQLLVTLADLDTEQQLERIYDDLRVAEATLHAEVARQRWDIDVQSIESDRAVSEYSQSLSELERQSAELMQRRNVLRRTQLLAKADAATDEQLESVQISEDGQRRLVQALKNSVEDLRERAARVGRLLKPGSEQIEPAAAKCNSLLNELDRINERLKRRLVLSTVTGTILRRHRSVGEQTSQAEPVFSILETDSTLIELFLPQNQSGHFALGDELSLNIEPYQNPLVCEVVRIGDELVPPPESVEVHYHARTRVVSVYLRPVSTQNSPPPVRIGSIVQLSRDWN